MKNNWTSPPQPSPPAKSAGGEGVTSLRRNIFIYSTKCEQDFCAYVRIIFYGWIFITLFKPAPKSPAQNHPHQ